MTPLAFLLTVLGAAVGAGALGSLLGLGGGIIMVPVLTLGLGAPLPQAVGASAVAVIATSGGSALPYVRSHLANVRIGLWLALGGTAGALTGALLVDRVSQRFLYFLFGALLVYSAAAILRGPRVDPVNAGVRTAAAGWLPLAGEFYDATLGQRVRYTATRPGWGLLAMYVSGVIGGLLGLGAGALNVLTMDQVMRLPVKVAAATSSFIVGMTATAAAAVYFSRGQIQPLVAAPVAVGVLCGAAIGTRIMVRLQGATIRRLFVPVLLYIAGQMLWRGWNLG